MPPLAAGRALVVCEQWLGSNGYAGMKALRRQGWAAQVVPEFEHIPLRWRSLPMRAVGRVVRARAVREFNRELLLWADRTRPDLFLAFKGQYVEAATLREMRRRDIRTYCFYPDVSFRVHGRYLPESLVEYDWIFTTKSFGLRDLREQLGMTRASLLLHAYDPDLHRPVTPNAQDVERYGCDVSFIGTWSPKKEGIIMAILEARPRLRVRVWGEQWHRAAHRERLRGVIGGHEIIGQEYARAICASSVNLAILSEQRAGASDGDRITSRTFHIPACGGFMVHERTDEVRGIFREGVEIACYEHAAELTRVLDEYLAAPDRRAAMAARARATVEAHHSWDHRIREILAHHANTDDMTLSAGAPAS